MGGEAATVSHHVFLWAFALTLVIAAGVWAAMVVQLVRLSRPMEGGAGGPLRRVMGIEIVWTLVPAAMVIALAIRVFHLPGW